MDCYNVPTVFILILFTLGNVTAQVVPTSAAQPTQQLNTLPLNEVPTQQINTQPLNQVPTQQVNTQPINQVPTQQVNIQPINRVPTQQINTQPLNEVQPEVVVETLPAPTSPNTVDAACLHCICMASSECRPLSCHLAGPGQYYCGHYLISWAYWADAGKPQDDVNNPYAFEICLKNKECSEQAVRGYMARYGQDCNADGLVTCVDYARIHKSGAYGCNATWIDTSNYYQAFLKCWHQPQ